MTLEQIDAAALALAHYEAEHAGFVLPTGTTVDDLEDGGRYRQMAIIAITMFLSTESK